MNRNIFYTILTVSVLMLTSCGSSSDNSYNADVDTTENYDDLDEEGIYANYYFANDDDENEEEDYIDLSSRVTYFTDDGNMIYISRDSDGHISGHDLNGNFYSGYTDEYGYTSIHDMDGHYTYSHTDEYGYTTGHDLEGNFF